MTPQAAGGRARFASHSLCHSLKPSPLPTLVRAHQHDTVTGKFPPPTPQFSPYQSQTLPNQVSAGKTSSFEAPRDVRDNAHLQVNSGVCVGSDGTLINILKHRHDGMSEILQSDHINRRLESWNATTPGGFSASPPGAPRPGPGPKLCEPAGTGLPLVAGARSS